MCSCKGHTVANARCTCSCPAYSHLGGSKAQPLPQVGDLVEVTHPNMPDFLLRGFVESVEDTGVSGNLILREVTDGFYSAIGYHWTVVRPAPKPLYVNSTRTEPFVGDVVQTRWADEDWDTAAWTYIGDGKWVSKSSQYEKEIAPTPDHPITYRLIVDGRTGEVTPR